MNTVLSRYIVRHYLTCLLIVLLVLATIIFLANFVENIRRYDWQTQGGLIIMVMSFLNLPNLLERTMPFSFLLAGLWSSYSLTRSHELIIARACGLSIKKFVIQYGVTAAIIGLLTIMLYNPLSAASLKLYQEWRTQLSGYDRDLANQPESLWFKQTGTDYTDIIEIQDLLTNNHLKNITIFRFKRDSEHLIGRYWAKSGQIKDQFIYLNDREQLDDQGRKQVAGQTKWPLYIQGLQNLTQDLIHPQHASIWRLPTVIQTLQKAGMNTTAHYIQFYQLLVTPLFFAIMAMLAAVSVPNQMRNLVPGMKILGIFLAGFGGYMLTKIMEALAIAQAIPAIMAILLPMMMALLLLAALTIKRETEI